MTRALLILILLVPLQVQAQDYSDPNVVSDLDSALWAVRVELASVKASLASNEFWLKTVLGGIVGLILKELITSRTRKDKEN